MTVKVNKKRHYEFSKHLRVSVKFGAMTFDLTSSSREKLNNVFMNHKQLITLEECF